jgi:uncharacterized protein YyaL (SSP411 family)
MPNRLAAQTSPYLRQHADNPVDWYPWGEEALQLARALDKPILLSVGYSACHWCHVMAHESFEDTEVAAEMNRLFVNIKVDREERPDLDQIYQTAHQLLARRGGGWPLTMFLMPDGTPFFGGTYFPNTPRYGMPGFRDLLPRIAAAYREQRAEIERQNAGLLQALSQFQPAPDAACEPKRDPLDLAVREFARVFDDVHGGLGSAPKFPHPHELAWCLRRHVLDGSEMAATIVRLTLAKMAEGGIYDQLGGGFCRYSVDRNWTIPHFEKMLYDNGPLLALYSDAWRVTRDPLHAKVARETAAWTLREMQAPEGGYYSSLDADSEHEEGRFYVWTPQEVRALMTADEYAVAEPHYGLDGAPNFENQYWHLHVAKPLAFVAQRLGASAAECETRLDAARAKLLAARAKRVWPGRDEKVLTSWNGLMIRGMARAAAVFGNREWLASAQRAADFVRTALWRDGRLLATCKDGRAHLNAYLDDHAFMLDGLLELMQAEFRIEDYRFACALADLLLSQFEDRDRGGFFFVSHDHEKLIHRAKPGPDNATPSGNGIAAFALQRLGHLAGEPRYLNAGERTLRLFCPSLERQPSAYSSLLGALEEWLEPPQTVILRGPDAPIEDWRQDLAADYRPATMVLAIPSRLQGLPASLDKPEAANVSGWICRGVSCLAPIAGRDELKRALKSLPSRTEPAS